MSPSTLDVWEHLGYWEIVMWNIVYLPLVGTMCREWFWRGKSVVLCIWKWMESNEAIFFTYSCLFVVVYSCTGYLSYIIYILHLDFLSAHTQIHSLNRPEVDRIISPLRHYQQTMLPIHFPKFQIQRRPRDIFREIDTEHTLKQSERMLSLIVRMRQCYPMFMNNVV